MAIPFTISDVSAVKWQKGTRMPVLRYCVVYSSVLLSTWYVQGFEINIYMRVTNVALSADTTFRC